MKDQKELGIGNFSKIPNGIGGVEHRMELIYQGVVDRRALAGAVGRDVLHDAGADVRHVPEEGDHRARAPTPTSSCGTRTRKTKIGINDKHHMNMDHSAWEGCVIDGKVDTVLVARHGGDRGRCLRRPQGSRPIHRS